MVMAVSANLAKLAPTAGWYAKGWRKVVAAAKADPGMRMKDPFDDFGRSVSVAEMRAKMAKALNARINTRGGLVIKPDDVELMREARTINEMAAARAAGRGRLRVYRWHSKLANKRFSHLLADRSDV